MLSYAAPQKDVPASQETILTFVHDFLKVFYPDLFDEKHTLKLCITHPASSSWREIAGMYFTVTTVVPEYQGPEYRNGILIPPEKPAVKEVSLDGSIWLPDVERAGRIQQVTTLPTGSNVQKLEALRQQIQLHSEWSEDQCVRALKQAGARFGPADKSAFVRSLPLDQAEPFLGHLIITSVEFGRLRAERVAYDINAGPLEWQVRTTAHLSDGKDAVYFLNFEPFEGKLISLMRF